MGGFSGSFKCSVVTYLYGWYPSQDTGPGDKVRYKGYRLLLEYFHNCRIVATPSFPPIIFLTYPFPTHDVGIMG